MLHELIKWLRALFEVIKSEDRFGVRQIIRLQIVVQARTRCSKVWNARAYRNTSPRHHTDSFVFASSHVTYQLIIAEVFENPTLFNFTNILVSFAEECLRVE